MNKTFKIILITIGLLQFNLIFSQLPTPIYRFEFNGSRTSTSGNETFSGPPAAAGANYVGDRFGNAGSAIRFHANYTTTVSLPLLPQGNSARTISIWVNFENGSRNDNIFLYTFGNNSSNQGHGLWQSQNRVMVTSHFGTPVVQSAARNKFRYLNAGATGRGWYHYVLSYDGTTCNVYRNGNLVASGTPPAWNTTGTAFTLGSNLSNFNTTNALVAFDDLEIYNVALSVNDIKNMYVAQAPLNQTSMVAYFPFDGNLNSHNNAHSFSNFPSTPGGTFITGYDGQGLNFQQGQGFRNNTLHSVMNNNNVTISFWMRRSGFPLAAEAIYETMVEAFGSFSFSERDWTIGKEDFITYWRTTSAIFRASNPFDKDFGTWYHVTIQFANAGSERFLFCYLDGELVISQMAFPNTSIARFHNFFTIGGGTENNNSGFYEINKSAIGDLDELYIFNRVLSLPEIMALRYQKISTLSTDEVTAKDRVIIYPNPASGEIQVKLPQNEHAKSIRIFNTNGQLILKPNKEIIQIQHLSPGVYFIQVETLNGESFSEKFIKN